VEMQYWGDITSSSDGNKLAAGVGVPGGGCCAGNIWTSTNSGAAWTEVTSTGSAKIWFSITSSSDGTKLAAVAYGGNIWTFEGRATGGSVTTSAANTTNASPPPTPPPPPSPPPPPKYLVLNEYESSASRFTPASVFAVSVLAWGVMGARSL
jgi:hypothetical protein